MIYLFLHESSHAIVNTIFTGHLTEIHLHPSGFFGYAVCSDSLDEYQHIIVLLAGSIGGFLLHSFLSAILLYRVKNSFLTIFQLFNILSKMPMSIAKLYTRLVVVIIGYYLHWNRIVYACFPGIPIFGFQFFNEGDGTQLWNIITKNKETINLLFIVGLVVNYIGLILIVQRACSAVEKFHNTQLIKNRESPGQRDKKGSFGDSSGYKGVGGAHKRPEDCFIC